jgi:hypothetical protein
METRNFVVGILTKAEQEPAVFAFVLLTRNNLFFRQGFMKRENAKSCRESLCEPLRLRDLASES